MSQNYEQKSEKQETLQETRKNELEENEIKNKIKAKKMIQNFSEKNVLCPESEPKNDIKCKSPNFKDIHLMFENMSKLPRRKSENEKMPENQTLFSKTSSKVNPRGSPKKPQQQPTFDRGKKSENKTNHCLSPAKQPHLSAANIKPKIINSARIKAIYKHFQRKVLHPDSKTATNKVVHTDFCD